MACGGEEGPLLSLEDPAGCLCLGDGARHSVLWAASAPPDKDIPEGAVRAGRWQSAMDLALGWESGSLDAWPQLCHLLAMGPG